MGAGQLEKTSIRGDEAADLRRSDATMRKVALACRSQRKLLVQQIWVMRAEERLSSKAGELDQGDHVDQIHVDPTLPSAMR